MKKKIIVGITASKRKIKVNFLDNQCVTLISDNYLDILSPYSNVIPIIIPVNCASASEKIISTLDGLILSSGEDIDPVSYKKKPLVNYSCEVKGLGGPFHRPMLLAPNRQRDESEKTLYLSAKKKKIPILGICRGMQLINVAEGGTLLQEIPQKNLHHFLEDDGWINYHEIHVKKNSKTHSVLGKSQISIASVHHQAIDKLGKELTISAVAQDGIVEIIESTSNDHFILGVQGHIETMLNNYPVYKKLIDAFILAIEKGV